MSLINETLHNLNNKSYDRTINPSLKSRVLNDKKISKSSPQNLLIISISFGIIVALFYIIYHPQINSYLFNSKSYVAEKSRKLVSSMYGLKGKFQFDAKFEKNKDNPIVGTASLSVQSQYYNAMNLLNEGNADQALRSLRDILKEDPDFKPAQQAISMLKSR